jgi:hypothetical protein
MLELVKGLDSYMGESITDALAILLAVSNDDQ